MAAAVLPRPALAGLVAASYLALRRRRCLRPITWGGAGQLRVFRDAGHPGHACFTWRRPRAGRSPPPWSQRSAPGNATLALRAWHDQPLHGVPLVLLVVVGAWLTYLTLSVLGDAAGGPGGRGAGPARRGDDALHGAGGAHLELSRLTSLAAGLHQSLRLRRQCGGHRGRDGSGAQARHRLRGDLLVRDSACGCGTTCCSGFTDFCCSVNGGYNYCPTNTVMGGWWKADNSSFCGGPRYYMDCNATCQCTTGCGNGFNFCDTAMRRHQLRLRARTAATRT